MWVEFIVLILERFCFEESLAGIKIMDNRVLSVNFEKYPITCYEGAIYERKFMCIYLFFSRRPI